MDHFPISPLQGGVRFFSGHGSVTLKCRAPLVFYVFKCICYYFLFTWSFVRFTFLLWAEGFHHSVMFIPVTFLLQLILMTWTSATCYEMKKTPLPISSTSPSRTTVRHLYFSIYFCIEILPTLWLALLCMSPKVLSNVAKWHFNKMLKDTNWLRWRSNLPLLGCGIVSVTFRLISSGESVTCLASNNNSPLDCDGLLSCEAAYFSSQWV